MAEEPWGAGYVIDGKYRLVLKLGEGGMGAVWRADHLTLNAPVAVKLLDPSIAATEEGLARFLREAQSAAALRGAHVVQTFDYGVSAGVPFIVMELLLGESLADRLESKGPLPPQAAASLLKQVCRAITKAHQAGIVHRDLKPDNIFLVEGDEDEPVAKVLDFGIAKSKDSGALGGSSKTRTGALMGTPYYMSPEQAQGIREVDYRTDLWALAVITFEALTGKRPFDSEALGDLLLRICAAPIPVPSEIGPVPAGFDAWFAKAANREPAERFASAAEMAKAFTALLDPGKPTSDSFKSVSTVTSAVKNPPAGDSLEGSEVVPLESRRNRVKWLVGTATLAVAAVVVVGLSRHASPAATENLAAPSASAPVAAAVPSPLVPASAEAPAKEPEVVPVPAPADSASAVPAASAVTRSPAPKALHHGVVKTSPKAPASPATAPKKSNGFDPLQMRR